MKSVALGLIALGFGAVGTVKVTAPDDASVPSPVEAQAISDIAYGSPPARAPCVTTALASEILAQQDVLAAQELSLAQSLEDLARAKALMDTQIVDLEDAQAQLDATAARLDSAADADLDHLVRMYSTMKPKNAAAIFDQMDPAFAAGFLRSMDSARAGMVMAEMAPATTYKISLLIASKRSEWRRLSEP